MKRDVPDYKPFPLRPPFLAALLLLVCSLFATLEYLLHTLPQEHDRTGIPHDSPFVPFRKRSAESESKIPSHILTTTKREQQQQQQPDRRVPPSTNFAGTAVITTRITVADRWYGDAGDPFQRTPLFPNDDASGKCIYYYAGIVITKEESGCLAVVGLPESEPLPPGLKRAPWFRDVFAFPEDSTCGDDMLRWFSTPRLAELPNLLDPELRSLWMGSLGGMFRAVESCLYPSGQPTLLFSSTKTATGVSPVLKLYAGLSAKRNGGIVRLMGGEPVIEKFCSLSAMSGVSEFGVIEMNSGVRQTLMAPRLITMPVAPSASCASVPAGVTTSASSSATTGTSGQSSIATPTGRPENSTPSPTFSSITIEQAPTVTDMAQVWHTITLPTHTFSSFTTNGTLHYSYIASFIPTTILINVPAILVTPSLQTTTDSFGVVTTITTFPGANPLLRETTTVLTDSFGSITATVRTSVPKTSFVRTTTDAQGKPKTETVFPVIPIVPDSRPAEDIVPITRYPHGVYFVVYFLPALLTALLLIPVQALDGELKLLMPYRILTKDSASTSDPPHVDSSGAEGTTGTANTGGNENGKGKQKIHPLTLHTRGIAGRLSGFRMLLDHGDPLPLLGDALVACAAMLVALSGETVGMKLRGSCLRVDVSSCIITVATFPGPARAVEALLGIMILLVVSLWWVLARWRSGVACHPGSVATVCGLLQIQKTVEILKTVKEPEKEMGKIQIKLAWTDEGPPAENYGLIIEKGSGTGSGTGVGIPAWRERTNDSTLTSLPSRGNKFGRDRDTQGLRLHVPTSERTTQGAFLLFLIGLMTLILYYEQNEFSDPSESAFEAFMDSQSFGVTMLFAVLGEVTTFTWDHIHNGEFLCLFSSLCISLFPSFSSSLFSLSFLFLTITNKKRLR